MHWIFFALVDVFGMAVANIIRRIIMKDDKSDAYSSVIFFQLLGFILILIVTLFRGFVMPPIATYPLNFLAEAILWGLSSYCLFKAFQFLEASEVTILTTFSSVVTITSAIIFLGDVFNLPRLIGVVLILFSVIFVLIRPKKMKLNQGVFYAIASSICMGLAITNDVFLIRHSDVFSLLVVGWFTPGLFLVLIKPQALKKINYFLKWNNLMKMLLLTVFYVTGGTAYYIAVTVGGQTSQVSPISQATIIVTIIFAAIFLKERDHLLKKIFSAILVTIGVLLLS